MNEQTLELQIKSKSQEAKANVESLVKSLTNVENSLNNIYLELGNIEKKSSVEKTTKQINTLKSSTDKASASVSKLSNNLKHLFTFAGVNRLTQTGLSWLNEAIDYTEQLNLFNVVFKNIEKNGTTMYSNLGKEATKYQYKMNEAFGTNKTQTLYMQGIFQSMGENVGIGDEYAGIMSETMTKLTYDLASLYNKSEKDTAEAIRAGVYAGQTKPLRSFGVDVTQMSMQPILDSLGIDRQVKELSQAEKEILRYLTTLEQAKVAMGDLANTIESPSNQLKVFRQQLIEAKTAFTSLFIGAFANIMPYVNAFLMVVKEVSKAIADMFGIKLVDYNSGIASTEDAFVDLGDSIDDATGKVKELKRQTLGFDEIHNINENNDSGSGSSLTGGIDQRLLDAIHGYDNGMDKVRMKATEIRDRIMEWLGFTKEIDPLTGEVSFKLKDGETRFKKILDFMKTIKDVLLFALDHANEIIATIIGYKLVKGLGNIHDTLKKISGLSFSNLSILGKIGLVAGGSTLLAEGTSKLPFYEDYVKMIMSEDYDGPTDVFGMWGEIGKGIKDLQTRPDEKKVQYDMLIKGLASIDYGKGKGNDITEAKRVFDEMAKDYFDMYEKPKVIDVDTSVYDALLEKFKSSVYQDYSQDALGNIVKTFGQSFFNNDDAVNITTYTDALKTYFNTISDGYDVLDGYSDKIKNNNEAYTNTSISLGNLLTKLTNADYEPTAQEIERINELFKQMGQISDDTAEENYQAVVKIMSNLSQHGYASDELTQKIMDNAFRQKEAQKGATQEQIEAMLNLEKQLRSGEITQQQYNQKVIELSKSFDEGNLVVGKAIITFDTLSQSVDITASSYDEATEAIGELKGAHSDATKTIKDGTKEQIDVLTEQMAKIDTTTEEGKLAYQNYADAISLLRQQEKDDLKDLNDKYALSMANMLQTLINSKEGQTTEGKKLQEQLNAELTKIGKGVDLSSNVADINRQLGKITGKTECTVTVRAEEDTYSFNKIKTTMSKLFGGLFSFGSGFGGGARANGGVYSHGIWHDIKQYANGGAPSHGTAFVAGEHGAEIVGHINGKTEVLNQSQIASAIYNAVASAMSQYSGGGIAEINVHADKGIIVETAVDGIQQHVNQTGQLPFTIPTY